jgi:polyphosphate glucokinase
MTRYERLRLYRINVPVEHKIIMSHGLVTQAASTRPAEPRDQHTAAKPLHGGPKKNVSNASPIVVSAANDAPTSPSTANDIPASITTPKIVEETPKDVPASPQPTKILVVDIGGTKIKVLASGQTEPRKAGSGKRLTPAKMVEVVKELTSDWVYDGVSIGYPGMVGGHGPRSEPGNLGAGWVGFNFAAAFDRPVRVINDAAMQALGSYEGGRMLFLGLGTGLGSALIAENDIIPLELGQLQHKDGGNLGEVLGKKGLERLGKEAWTQAVAAAVAALTIAFMADYVVLGGGNAKKMKGLVPGIRLGHNLTAFRGGRRLWNIEHVPTLSTEGNVMASSPPPASWRVL